MCTSLNRASVLQNFLNVFEPFDLLHKVKNCDIYKQKRKILEPVSIYLTTEDVTGKQFIYK
jgi:hypothetical protein